MQQHGEETLVPLKPFSYSFGIYVFAFIMFFLFCCSLWLMPEYTEAARKLAKAERALNQKKYEKALLLYEELLKQYPDFENARKPAAIACFNIRTEKRIHQAFAYLKGLKFGIFEQIEFKDSVPEEIREYINFSKA
jgi:hypothetical protein